MSPIQRWPIHTAIGGSYDIEDEHLAMEPAERLDPGSDEILATAVKEGALGLCDVRFNGVELTGRSLSSQGWWAVAFAVGPTTSAFCTGRGDAIPSLDAVTVRSFDDLSEPVGI